MDQHPLIEFFQPDTQHKLQVDTKWQPYKLLVRDNPNLLEVQVNTKGNTLAIDHTHILKTQAVLMVPNYEGTQLKSITLVLRANPLLSITLSPVSQNDSCTILYKRLIKSINHRGFTDYYKALKRSGRGNFATVYLVEHKYTKEQYAAKVFNKMQQYSQLHGQQALQNEIEILRSLQHPNIMGFYGVYETESLVYVVIEYLQGGTLEDYMKSKMKQSGHEIKKMAYQVLSGLAYLDEQNIMHRDLKASNIMCSDESGDWKITDFGLAARTNSEYLYHKCGTPGHIAPEILNLENQKDKYSQICDMFSFGVILFNLIVGRAPFPGTNYDDVYTLNKSGKVTVTEEEAQSIHPHILAMILQMLEADPRKRLRAKDALRCTLFTDKEVEQSLEVMKQKQRQSMMDKILKMANYDCNV